MDFAAKLESEIEKVEPDFIEKARMLLKMPLLVFKEHNFVIFNSVGVKNCAAGKILEYENKYRQVKSPQINSIDRSGFSVVELGIYFK